MREMTWLRSTRVSSVAERCSNPAITVTLRPLVPTTYTSSSLNAYSVISRGSTMGMPPPPPSGCLVKRSASTAASSLPGAAAAPDVSTSPETVPDAAETAVEARAPDRVAGLHSVTAAGGWAAAAGWGAAGGSAAD